MDKCSKIFIITELLIISFTSFGIAELDVSSFSIDEILNSDLSYIKNLSRIHRELIPNTYGTFEKCIKEIPTEFIKSVPDEVIHGNGSNEYLLQIEDCCEGYKRYEYNLNLCIPDCGDKCKNGICLAPGVCTCFPGFVKSDSGECVTTCPHGCLNGKCYSNGKCECENYHFELNSEGTFCRPRCDRDCYGQNKNCSAPNQCTCQEGYKFDQAGNCIPSCKADCYRGICVAPNQCQCDYSFNLKDGICQAKCNRAVCTNGICLTDGTCKCLEGYRYDHKTTTCLPICNIDCEHGICVGLNKCKCYKGYGQLNNRGPCIPICDPNCCIKPGICDCKPKEGEGQITYYTLRNLAPGRYCIS